MNTLEKELKSYGEMRSKKLNREEIDSVYDKLTQGSSQLHGLLVEKKEEIDELYQVGELSKLAAD